MSLPPPVDRMSLETLFRPRTLALVGASDKSPFSRLAYGMAKRFGAAERTYLINPRTPTVHGVATLRSCHDIPGGVDCAYVMVPRNLVIPSLEEAAAAGARSAVVLSGGFAETGPEGTAAQDALVDRASQLGLTLLGPNHLGFANVVDKVVACALPDVPTSPGPLALVSQSGALAGVMLKYAAQHGMPFSYVVTTGNEAMVTVEDVLDFLIDDPSTRAIAVFAEVFRRPALFRSAARRARQAGKAIVLLKAGASELSAQTAAAHTGALTGDDRVIDAMLRQEAVIRVGHLEELLVTANVAAHTGPWRRRGVAFASISGGACDVIADRAAESGLELPELTPETQENLRKTISALGAMHNPLDVTGTALIDTALFGKILAELAQDPDIGFVGAVMDLPLSDHPASSPVVLDGIGAALAASPIPGAFIDTMSAGLRPHGRELLQKHALGYYIPSVRDAVAALGKIGWWSERVAQLNGRAPLETPVVSTLRLRGRRLSEAAARDLLTSLDIPVVPGALATSEEAAVEIAGRLEGPVVLKVVSPDIAHKTDVGGVLLDVRGADAVRTAHRSILRAVQKISPQPEVEGVLVTAMRPPGAELLVGVVRDPSWGPVLALGTGGVFVEVLDDTRLLLLPAHPDDICAAILDLKSAPVLRGVRGAPAADLPKLVATIRAIADLALSLGDELEALEINPLRVRGSEVEALDVLLTWQPTPPA